MSVLKRNNVIHTMWQFWMQEQPANAYGTAGGSQQTFRTRNKLTGRRPLNRELFYFAVNNATILKHNPKPDQLILLKSSWALSWMVASIYYTTTSPRNFPWFSKFVECKPNKFKFPRKRLNFSPSISEQRIFVTVSNQLTARSRVFPKILTGPQQAKTNSQHFM
jgi:hypothetical protein